MPRVDPDLGLMMLPRFEEDDEDHGIKEKLRTYFPGPGDEEMELVPNLREILRPRTAMDAPVLPAQAPGDRMDFLKPPMQGQRPTPPGTVGPGMKSEDEERKFLRERGFGSPMTPKEKAEADEEDISRMPLDSQERARAWIKRNGSPADYEFQGMEGSPDLPSEDDSDFIRLFGGGDKDYQDFVERFGERALDKLVHRQVNEPPLPRPREPHVGAEGVMGPEFKTVDELIRQGATLSDRNIGDMLDAKDDRGGYEYSDQDFKKLQSRGLIDKNYRFPSRPPDILTPMGPPRDSGRGLPEKYGGGSDQELIDIFRFLWGQPGKTEMQQQDMQRLLDFLTGKGIDPETILPKE